MTNIQQIKLPTYSTVYSRWSTWGGAAAAEEKLLGSTTLHEKKSNPIKFLKQSKNVEQILKMGI
jgi:hypothetical protein